MMVDDCISAYQFVARHHFFEFLLPGLTGEEKLELGVNLSVAVTTRHSVLSGLPPRRPSGRACGGDWMWT